jgi:hypothetical protein
MATSNTDKMMKAVEAARARSGANVGPPKPLSDEMLKRIQQNVDKDNKKTSQADSSDDTVYAKKGGMTASKRADGIAQRGKTRGTIVMCGGGMYKK